MFFHATNIYIYDAIHIWQLCVVHLSAVPKMYFTSTTYTLAEAGNACSHPLMTAGKTVTREGRLVFPLSIYVDHSFVDGSHLASFFGKIEEYLKEISHE